MINNNMIVEINNSIVDFTYKVAETQKIASNSDSEEETEDMEKGVMDADANSEVEL